MIQIKKIIFIVAILIASVQYWSPTISLARENVDYWYIKNFQTEIIVNKDSSLDIIEKITADCGLCRDKHGIFRTLPTRYSPQKDIYVDTPISLINITDFSNRSQPYQTTNDSRNHTITWKIGDPNKEVQGVNNYQIHYQVKSALRTHNSFFDEFYWNLSGNFWDLDIDHFTANIDFPAEINQQSAKEINLYSGVFSEKDQKLADFEWSSSNQIKVRSNRTLKSSGGRSEGITLSVTFPKGIVNYREKEYQDKVKTTTNQSSSVSVTESKKSPLPYLFIPVSFLIICLILWFVYGRDPKINPTVAPEFAPPENLPPMELGMVYSDGWLKNEYISAAIINLAVKGIIKIEEVKAGISILQMKGYTLTRLKDDFSELTAGEKLLVNRLFGKLNPPTVSLASLKNKFYNDIRYIEKKIKEELKLQNLLLPRSRALQRMFLTITYLLVFIGIFWQYNPFGNYFRWSLIASAVVIFIFSFLIKQRTRAGAEFYRRIQGFKLYLETAEKYRQRFFEKENIFERFLPYAIMFGLTKLWINKMAEIYGQDWLENYYPVWFAGSIASFNADSLNSAISSLSSIMASTLSSSPSSSGSGGGGFSGGGGGGGGGGGW